MKWLWIACPDRLCSGSYSVTFPNGTFPIASANRPSRSPRAGSANERLTIFACGYSCSAICAVVPSSSTPTIRASLGARPMNTPAPHPGSITSPPANPSSPASCHIAAAIAGCV